MNRLNTEKQQIEASIMKLRQDQANAERTLAQEEATLNSYMTFGAMVNYDQYVNLIVVPPRDPLLIFGLTVIGFLPPICFGSVAAAKAELPDDSSYILFIGKCIKSYPSYSEMQFRKEK